MRLDQNDVAFRVRYMLGLGKIVAVRACTYSGLLLSRSSLSVLGLLFGNKLERLEDTVGPVNAEHNGT